MVIKACLRFSGLYAFVAEDPERTVWILPEELARISHKLWPKIEVVRADRVGVARLCLAEPERGKVWKPSQGFHQNRLARGRDSLIAAVLRPPSTSEKLVRNAG